MYQGSGMEKHKPEMPHRHVISQQLKDVQRVLGYVITRKEYPVCYTLHSSPCSDMMQSIIGNPSKRESLRDSFLGLVHAAESSTLNRGKGECKEVTELGQDMCQLMHCSKRPTKSKSSL
jgi:hypothetical protein